MTLARCWAALGVILVLMVHPWMARAADLPSPKDSLTQFKIDTWQTEQGLPLNTVQSLLQTRDGYLWVGTGGGLSRFDGVRFTTFDSLQAPTWPPSQFSV